MLTHPTHERLITLGLTGMAKGNFPSSRSFLIHLDASWLDPFTNVLPRTTLDPPFPVTRVIRLALEVLLRSPTPACASQPAS